MLNTISGDEAVDYALNLDNLMNLVEETNPDLIIPALADYARLLRVKAENNMLDVINISSTSGMIKLKESADLRAEKRNVEFEIQGSYSFEEIKQNILKKIEKSDYDIAEEMSALAQRYYLSVLEESHIDEDFFMTAKLLESGDKEDLARFIITGYNTTYDTFCQYDIDAFLKNRKILNKKRVKATKGTECEPTPYLENLLIGNFGYETNVFFHLLQQEKGLTPRRVKKTLIAPFYSRHVAPNEGTLNIDLNFPNVYKAVFTNNPDAFILAINSEESTQHYNIFNTEDVEKPHITISNKYFCNPETKALLKGIIPKENIIDGNN